MTRLDAQRSDLDTSEDDSLSSFTHVWRDVAVPNFLRPWDVCALQAAAAATAGGAAPAVAAAAPVEEEEEEDMDFDLFG